MKREVTEKQRTFVDKSPTIGRLTVAFGPFLKKAVRNTRMREYKNKLGKGDANYGRTNKSKNQAKSL